MLDVGSVILPGNWGRLEKASLGAGSPIIFREYVLESLRAKEFPDKPSRMQATYSCPDIQSMVMFMQANCPTSLCYEVEIIDREAPAHRAPCKIVGPADNQNTWDWAMSEAAKYWSWNQEHVLRPMEMVSASPLRIISKGKNLQEVLPLAQTSL